MNDIAVQVGLVLGVLSACFVGPGLAMTFLLWRKRRQRARRRSPIGINLLRSPGHSLAEDLEAVGNDLTWDVVVLATLPLLVLALFLAQAHGRGGLSSMSHLIPIYVAAVLVLLGVVLAKMKKRAEQLDRLRAGYDAEVAVGQELDKLMRSGAYVFHDFPAEGFNIDHVVVSTQGVFVVETKGYTKSNSLKGKEAATVVFDGQVLKFPIWPPTSAPIDQAARQAAWFAKWASSAVGDEVSARPVLALPGWFVQRSGQGAVTVFSGRELPGLLRATTDRSSLSATMVERVAHQVDQRCRTVVPTYKRDTSVKEREVVAR